MRSRALVVWSTDTAIRPYCSHRTASHNKGMDSSNRTCAPDVV